MEQIEIKLPIGTMTVEIDGEDLLIEKSIGRIRSLFTIPLDLMPELIKAYEQLTTKQP